MRHRDMDQASGIAAILGDVGCEAAQGLEDLLVALVVRAQLEAVLARDLERDLEDVDRIEPQSFTVQRRRRRDLGGCDLEIQRLHQKHGQLVLQSGLFGCIAKGGNGGWVDDKRDSENF